MPRMRTLNGENGYCDPPEDYDDDEYPEEDMEDVVEDERVLQACETGDIGLLRTLVAEGIDLTHRVLAPEPLMPGENPCGIVAPTYTLVLAFRANKLEAFHYLLDIYRLRTKELEENPELQWVSDRLKEEVISSLYLSHDGEKIAREVEKILEPDNNCVDILDTLIRGITYGELHE